MGKEIVVNWRADNSTKEIIKADKQVEKSRVHLKAKGIIVSC